MSSKTLCRRIVLLTHLLCLLGLLGLVSAGWGSDLPGELSTGPLARTTQDAAIEAQPLCVGSTIRSAGNIGPSLFYRRARLPDGRLAVGYYVFYSDERPWGNNWQTWLLFPALAIDLVYTRALLIAPGLQRAAYGKGDVEGLRVVYRVDEAGHLEAQEAFADDGTHAPVRLDRRDLFSIDPDRPTVYTDVWSHQLGAKGRAPGDLVVRRCYGAGTIRPLIESVAREFHLERRALPAAVGNIEPDPPPPDAVARRTDEAPLAPRL